MERIGRRVAGFVVALAVVCMLPGAADGAPNPGGNEQASVSAPPSGGKFLGFNEGMLSGAHGYTPAQHVQLAKNAGANLVRTALDWNFVEPTRDGDTSETWAPATDFYNAALAQGVTPMFMLGFAPEWARDPGGYARECEWWCPYVQFPPSRSMNDEWVEHVSEAARRFPNAMFEIWNEPNLVGYWESGPDPQRYAELVATAYDAIKAQSKAAKVLAGALSIHENTNAQGIAMGEFVRRAYAANPSIKGKMDYLSFHPFPYSTTLWSSGNQDTFFARAFASIRAARSAAGDSVTPLFLTEIGVSTGPPESLTEAQQADTMLRAYRRTMTMTDVKGIVLHRLFQPSHWTSDQWELGMGFLSPGGFPPTPRTVYCRFVSLAQKSYAPCPPK